MAALLLLLLLFVAAVAGDGAADARPCFLSPHSGRPLRNNHREAEASEEGGSVPAPRSWHVAHFLEPQHMLVYGGLGADAPGGQGSADASCYDDVWLYDLKRHTWEELPISAPPR